MKLTVLDVAVILDTLQGSLGLKSSDFKYTEEARRELLASITEQAGNQLIEVKRDHNV